MSEYKIPDNYYFRLHHVRPRFKNDIENVLFYMAREITAIGERNKDDFKQAINNAIRNYTGNATYKQKTIENWRTEISALFGFIEHTETTDKPGRRAIDLANHQDLVESFKVFLYNFQYPGAHIKPVEILEEIKQGVHFKPAQYILNVLNFANKNEKRSVGLTKGEICHCIFNDLRVTRDCEGAEKTWQRIKNNRNQNYTYDLSGDVIRYAGDIVDYMVIANLLKTYDYCQYYLNKLEEVSIIKFCNSKEWFSGYDSMIANREGTLEAIKSCTNDWFAYVNRDLEATDFATDILAYIATDEKQLEKLKTALSKMNETELSSDLKKSNHAINQRIGEQINSFNTKDIGEIGESLVYGHECMRLKLAGREDLIHLIKRIPTFFAIGYDISSVETDERKRYIEVKTTISSAPLTFNKLHLTRNEWNTADTLRGSYYIYRLFVNKSQRKLFLMQDPVGLYKNSKINMVSYDGAEISFNPDKVGRFEELLSWS